MNKTGKDEVDEKVGVESSSGISRRDLLRMSGIAAMGIAGTAALPGCSTQTSSDSNSDTASEQNEDTASGTTVDQDPFVKPSWLEDPLEIAESDIAETVECDVVVCGAGIAGVGAIRTLAEGDATVCVFEKCDGVQGRSGDFGTINAACTERYNMGDQDTEALVAELMKESGYKADYRVLKAWVENSGADFDWYVGAVPDMPFLDAIDSPQPSDTNLWIQPERYPLPSLWTGNDNEYYSCYQTTVRIYEQHVPVLQANYDIAVETGNVVSENWYTPAVKLLTDNEGAVTGVIAKRSETGEYIQANASKGVILATGDYSGNKDMLYYYCPQTIGIMSIFSSMDFDENVANTGDGQRMGMQIGAKMEDTPHGPMIHHMGTCMGTSCFLELNRDGQRFMNEDIPGQQIENQVEAQPGKYVYQFFDGGWKEQVPHFKPEHGACCYVLEDGVIDSGTVNATLTHKDSFAYQEQIDEAVESGATLKADTIEELLDLIGSDIDKDAALASIQRYNELAKAGHDEDFGKRSDRLFALETAPFYASKMETSTLLVCMGGLQSDEKCQVYKADGSVIPNLYVAGNAMGNRFKVQYPTTVPGVSHSVCLTEGRLAARNILGE